MSVATVFTTSMIYASLKAIPAWRTGWTVAGYVVLSLATGAVLGAFLHAAFALPDRQSVLGFGFALLAVGLAVKLAYWAERRRAATTSTAESATGLGRFGRVRLIDAPHTEANYLLEEMGYQIARKHADKLRRIAIVAGFFLPAAFIGVALAWGGGAPVLLALSAVSCGVGVAVERWLFFAEAKHVVTLYYGEERV